MQLAVQLMRQWGVAGREKSCGLQMGAYRAAAAAMPALKAGRAARDSIMATN
jgi:hypothetical protein